ncbi:hypothetical protein [Streptomyces bambusae]|uniref:Uncharacterized protein n=1 Tax=Streptomyces bambusae TaxID=1550616 RepID=A0ABS6Z5I9_9ACTN|nr:hypothetical protein [Streptomyces bambusae]MBW5483043.1 hypothetical protein [Streptomyces bambusae]
MDTAGDDVFTSKRRESVMTTEELAKFYALLTILEPQTQVCLHSARLAEVGTVGDGNTDTDTAVLKQLKTHADKISAELASVKPEKLQRKTEATAKLIV